MVSILLIILKIIGIALLIILGLLLLLLLLVLFVPVRYRLKGDYTDGLHVKGKITWLLHLVSVKIEVEKETFVSVRILGIPLSVFQKKSSKKTSEKKVEVSERKTTSESTESAKTTSLYSEEKPGSELKPEVKQEPEVKSKENEKTQENLQKEPKPETLNKDIRQKKQKAKKWNISEKIAAIYGKIRTVKQKIQNFIKNCKDIKMQIGRYISVLQSDTAKAAFALCRNRIFKFLKHILPKKMYADITFGFDDPANTGYVLAVYGMLPSYVGENIIVHPDFDKQIFKGNFKIKGYIRAGTLLYHVLSILMDQNCRKLYYIVKKEIANEHK